MDSKRLSALVLSACLGISVLAGCSQTGNPASSFPPDGSSSPEWGEWHQWGDIGDGAYANPVLPADFSDIDCIKAGKWYYAITSTFQYSPGMLVLRSSDLVHWQYWSHAVDDLTQIGPELNHDRMNRRGKGIWAGAVRYHNHRFYLYFGTPDEGIFMTTSRDARHWEDLVCLIDSSGWDDCCPFFDEDGSVYLAVTHFSDNYKTWLYRLTDDGRSIDTTMEPVLLNEGNGREANKLYKIGEWYYHLYSEKAPGGRQLMMQRASSVLGPYLEKRPLSQVQHEWYEPNQGGLVPAPGGSWYFMTHHGRSGNWAGRIASLVPVCWVDEWPIVGIPGPEGPGRMPWTAAMPVSRRASRKSGSETLQSSDGFDSKELGPQWEWHYQPRKDMWSLTERKSCLRLYAFPPLGSDGRDSEVKLVKAGNTLTQRSFQIPKSCVTLTMDYSGMAEGQHAGLGHFSGDEAFLGLHRTAETCFLEFSAPDTLMVRELPGAFTDPSSDKRIWLRSEWSLDGLSRFSYSLDGADYQYFGSIYPLKWASYRGDRIAIYSFNPLGEDGYVDIETFDYPLRPAGYSIGRNSSE